MMKGKRYEITVEKIKKGTHKPNKDGMICSQLDLKKGENWFEFDTLEDFNFKLTELKTTLDEKGKKEDIQYVISSSDREDIANKLKHNSIKVVGAPDPTEE